MVQHGKINRGFFEKMMNIPSYFFVYLWLTFLVSWGFLLPGYILTLDMAWTPNMAMLINLDWSDSLFLWRIVVSIATFLLPAWLFQKILIISVFLISGVSVHYLVPVQNKFAKYFAGFFYMINPFVYTRLMAGQLSHLLAYAVFPFLIKLFFDLISKNDKTTLIKTVLMISVVAILSLHFFYISLFMFFLIQLTHLSKNFFVRREIIKFIKMDFKLLMSFFVLNFYWLLGVSKIKMTLSYFDQFHMQAFVTAPDDHFGSLFNVLAMYGFWGENYSWGDNVLWVKNILPFWYLIFFFLFLLVVFGIISGLKNKKQKIFSIVFLLAAICALIFSVGLSKSVFYNLNQFFYDNIPFLNGFRDSQKWSMLLVLSYALFGAMGLERILTLVETKMLNSKELYVKSISYLSYSLIFIYSFVMFAGFSGQLKPVFYPKSWHNVNEILNADQRDFNVLFLPWHTYMSFEFNNNRLVTNPADLFFEKPVIKADNLELGEVYSISNREESELVENLLTSKDKLSELPKLLILLNVKYVIYAKDLQVVEKNKYSFLEETDDLFNVYDKENLVLYKVVEA